MVAIALTSVHRRVGFPCFSSSDHQRLLSWWRMKGRATNPPLFLCQRPLYVLPVWESRLPLTIMNRILVGVINARKAGI